MKNPINIATDEVVALKYEGDGAPRVTAKGRGEIAKQILAIANEHEIPLYQDEQLTALLSQIDLGDEIPQQLYLAVAKVISFIYQLNGESRDFLSSAKQNHQESSHTRHDPDSRSDTDETP